MSRLCDGRMLGSVLVFTWVQVGACMCVCVCVLVLHGGRLGSVCVCVGFYMGAG